jgi:hypothetical protein
MEASYRPHGPPKIASERSRVHKNLIIENHASA